jgi:hypothetical protein
MLVAASWAGEGGRIHHASVAAGAGAAAAGITPSMGAKPPSFEDVSLSNSTTNVLLRWHQMGTSPLEKIRHKEKNGSVSGKARKR